MKHRGKTPPFRGPRGEVVAGSIAEIADRPLGGLDQWVMIRGQSVANPALVLLHGGAEAERDEPLPLLQRAA
jgi:proline iminopeptidase